ncbi:MAG TPA: DUF4339 domain-containing protein [Rhodoblastus sp.]|nr:DUF4339 domain-containing protein [Rhodoblastus sp.]
MAAYWYVGADNASKGPLELEELARLAREGVVQPTTLVWTDGMAEWTPAGSLAALTALLGAAPAAPPPPAPPPPAAQRLPGAVPSFRTAPVGDVPAGPLVSTVETFPLFGRAVLAWLGNIFVIPAPWTSAMYWKYLGETTRLPNGTPFAFEGQWRDIWWVFALQALLIYSNAVTGDHGFLALLGGTVLPYLVLRWFCEKLRVGPGGPFLAFKGEFLPYLGWMALIVVSFVTVIGWAWAMQYYLDWACRNVAGPVRFSFKGRGLEILWRCVVAGFGMCLIVPIPWLLAWLTRWFVSQIEAQAA